MSRGRVTCRPDYELGRIFLTPRLWVGAGLFGASTINRSGSSWCPDYESGRIHPMPQLWVEADWPIIHKLFSSSCALDWKQEPKTGIRDRPRADTEYANEHNSADIEYADLETDTEHAEYTDQK